VAPPAPSPTPSLLPPATTDLPTFYALHARSFPPPPASHLLHHRPCCCLCLPPALWRQAGGGRRRTDMTGWTRTRRRNSTTTAAFLLRELPPHTCPLPNTLAAYLYQHATAPPWSPSAPTTSWHCYPAHRCLPSATTWRKPWLPHPGALSLAQHAVLWLSRMTPPPGAPDAAQKRRLPVPAGARLPGNARARGRGGRRGDCALQVGENVWALGDNTAWFGHERKGLPPVPTWPSPAHPPPPHSLLTSPATAATLHLLTPCHH